VVHKLHYDLISSFNDTFYAGLLTEHDIKEEIHIKKLSFPDGGEDETANFWGYLLEKDGKQYLLSESDENGHKRDMTDIFPIKPKEVEKVANNGKVYYHILTPVSFRIRPECTMTFRELLQEFSSINHSNKKHQLLLWAVAFAQMFDRANIRLATNPGFGKDSTVDILGNLIGGAATIENPTIAKLEERANCMKWLAINEVVGVAKGDWKTIELFLLATGAHKPKITKRSRANEKVGEEIDISKLSLSLLFNDITDYSDPEDYFDSVTKKAVKDRFVPLRLYGRTTEDFNSISKVIPAEYAAKNKEYYLSLIRNFLYYKGHINAFTHGYDRSALLDVGGRWETNLNKVLTILDAYSETQQEFTEWVQTINKAVLDYQEMAKYPWFLEKLEKKEGKLSTEDHVKKLKKIDTFTEKNNYIKMVLKGEVPITDTGLEGWT